MAQRLLSYYGDDFTGSTDVMEALSLHGVRTVLFTRIPQPDEFADFAGYDAVGIAGTSRSQGRDWMDEHLPGSFSWLQQLNARFCHYKVCSTFDSSPTVGSIGKAIEIGRAVFGQETTPLVVGAPQLKRYTAFGHLFAAYQGQTYRIDRHPVMSRHPVTPMGESDLRLHLARQTSLPVVLAQADCLDTGIILFDVIDLPSQLETGRRLLRIVERCGPFIAGSSGVEYALVRALAQTGRIAGHATFASVPPVDRIIAVSGSCSPTTARQIRHALANGFSGIAADPLRLAGNEAGAEIAMLAAQSVQHLKEGRSVLIYTALDPHDAAGSLLDALPGGRNRVGEGLGRIANAVVRQCGLSRVVIAGGDTSSHALGQLDVFALTTRFPLKDTPGSPLCIAHSSAPGLNGIEIAMKGGQVGGDDYFAALRDGLPAA